MGGVSDRKAPRKQTDPRRERARARAKKAKGEVARLRAALTEIAQLPTYGIKDPHGFKEIAQAALDYDQQKGLDQ